MKTIFENYDKIINGLEPYGVNRGGCGFFAYELGKLLKDKNIKFRYVVLFNNINPKHNTHKLVKSNLVDNFNELSWTHVMINIEGYYIDATGIYKVPTFNGFKMRTRTLTETFFNTFVSVDKYWNRMFNRDYIKNIQIILKENLVVSN